MQPSLVPVRTGPNLSAPGMCGSDAPAPEFLPRCPGTWVLNLTLPPSSCVTFGKLLKFSELLSSSAKGQERAVDEMSKSFPAPWSSTFNELSLSWARRIRHESQSSIKFLSHSQDSCFILMGVLSPPRVSAILPAYTCKLFS